MNDLDRINRSLIAAGGKTAHSKADGRFTSGPSVGGSTATMGRKDLIAYGKAQGYTGTTSHSVTELRSRIDAHIASKQPTRAQPAVTPRTAGGMTYTKEKGWVRNDTGAPLTSTKSTAPAHAVLESASNKAEGSPSRKLRDDAYDQSSASTSAAGIKVKGGQNWVTPQADGSVHLDIGHDIGYDGDVSSSVSYRLSNEGGTPTASLRRAETLTDHEYARSGRSSYQGDAARAVVISDGAIRKQLADHGFKITTPPVTLADVKDQSL